MLNLRALKKPELQLRNIRQNQLAATQRLEARQRAIRTGPAIFPQIKSATGNKSGNSFLQQANDNEDSVKADRASVDPNKDQCVGLDQECQGLVCFQFISLY
jgi:hypothetical protein